MSNWLIVGIWANILPGAGICWIQLRFHKHERKQYDCMLKKKDDIIGKYEKELTTCQHAFYKAVEERDALLEKA